MTTGTQTGTQDDLAAQVADLARRAPMLTDRMIVDLVNGLEVTREHVRIQGRRQGLLDRAWDAFTGVGTRRQQAIDKNLAAGLEAASVWLQDLEAKQLQTDRGLTLVSHKLVETRGALRALGQHHVALRDQVAKLDWHVQRLTEDCDERISQLEAEIEHLRLDLSAKKAMDAVFDAWEAGEHYSAFPPLLQAALALEQLYWSPFRRYDVRNPELREQVANKCVIQLRRLGESPDQLVASTDWFDPIAAEQELVRAMVVRFFGRVSDVAMPLTTTLGDASTGLGAWNPAKLPADLPRVLSARGLSRRLTQETARRADGQIA